jgi:hypothetical protein
MLLPSPEGITSLRLIIHICSFCPFYRDPYLNFLSDYIFPFVWPFATAHLPTVSPVNPYAPYLLLSPQRGFVHT